MIENERILRGLESGLPVVARPDLGPYVRPSDAGSPFQRWFSYREGYTVSLCSQYIRSSDSLILDPFCGFGSTLLAAQRAGVASVGMDVSPLAAFVARVKTHKYNAAALRDIKASISRLRRVTVESTPAEAPVIRILPKLFHPKILEALLLFRAAIDRTAEAATRDFLMLAWVAILEDVSNVFREGNGVKYRNRMRGNEYSVRPYDEWESERFPRDKFDYVRTALLTHLKMMLEDASSASTHASARVVHDDVRNIAAHVRPQSVDLALFSPPYCNCFNYIKAYKLELWMAGFIRQYPDIRSLTKRGIRSRIESLLDPVTEPYPQSVETLAQLMARGPLWSPQLPDVVRGYFADIQATLVSLRRVLKKNGRCVIVVGNSAYGGTLIPSDLLIASMAESVGFDVSEVAVARHLTTSSQQRRGLAPIGQYMRESVITLQRGR
ncbi:MAG: hypothetical protein NTU67_08855 [Gemmatimonadetes bacterium]|nr:hypothetical protein [Gemmatimonadota bacterium]